MLGVDILIFVILGTQDKPFTRLLKQIEKEIKKGNIKEKVVVQAGITDYKSDNMEIYDLIPMSEFKENIKKSDYIITHGGVGSILDSLKCNKKVIAVPRLKEFGEHENDHQVQIVKKFEQLKYIKGCYKIEELGNIIKQLPNFVPQKYKSNNQRMIQLLENYIDNL